MQFDIGSQQIERLEDWMRGWYRKVYSIISANPKKFNALALATVFLIVAFYAFVVSAPTPFPYGGVVSIEEGVTVTEAADLFEERGIVRSSLWLRVFASVLGDERGVIAGDYFFPERENAFTVAHMITTGDYGLVPIKITIPEGVSVAEMGELLDQEFDLIDKDRFERLARGKEGYLFPDTYFFLPNLKERKAISVLEDTFFEKLAEVEDAIEAFGEPVDDVVTMASLIEKEAYESDDRRIISGILWKRIELGIPLQVDVTFAYINGKGSFQLTRADLREDHPYNTYTNKGLPPGPIANPGLDSLEAAVMPIQSDYLYFLADRRGNVHFSETFDEHKRKKALYF